MEARVRNIILFFVFVFAGLLIRAAQLQLIDASYQTKADSITVAAKVIYPSRGLFLDRKENILVENEPMYDVIVTANRVNPNMDTALFCKVLNMDRSEFLSRMNKDFKSPRYSRNIPFVFYSKLSSQEFAPIQEILFQFPGFDYVIRNKRTYPINAAAHVLGYLGEVNKKQIEENPTYARGDYIGVLGLESTYEDELRGYKGVRYVLKDNIGREVEELDQGKLDSSAINGRNVHLNLDIDLQLFGEKLMKGKSGAIVAIDPQTGGILASVTSPSYDPNLLSIGSNRGRAYNKLSADSTNPLLNRAIMSKYPPGSIIKPIWALIALQEGIINPQTHIACNGGYTYNQTTWKCHGSPGVESLISSIQHSCNTFYYITYKNLIEVDGFRNPNVGLDLVNSYLYDAGLGHKLGVDIKGENSGFLPTPDFYKKMYKHEGGRWYATYTISNGIGQGEFELTTIQMANLACILANRGYYYTPHFYRPVNLLDRTMLDTEKHVFPVEEKYFEPVIEGMYRAVHRGTASYAIIPGIDVCGKTGTSENSRGKDHSVFFGFAPKKDPKIAIAVYVENAGWGSSYATPIAGLMMEYYLNGKISPHRKWLENQMMNKTIIP